MSLIAVVLMVSNRIIRSHLYTNMQVHKSELLPRIGDGCLLGNGSVPACTWVR
jgi:hypothetical protein